MKVRRWFHVTPLMTQEVGIMESYGLVAGMLGPLAAGPTALAQRSGKHPGPDRSTAETQRNERMHGHDMMGGMKNGMSGGCMQMMQGMAGPSGGRPNEQ